ncbi:hypothetical protein [Nocardioides sp. MH1]|uniref:hypothetical protein n=1 Tax=Nocardioides sp. MH1 TaxID=3242490 RepID=UPI0035208B93
MNWTFPNALNAMRVIFWGLLTAGAFFASLASAIHHDFGQAIAGVFVTAMFGLFFWIAARRLDRMSRGDYSRDKVATAGYLGVVGTVLLILGALEVAQRI